MDNISFTSLIRPVRTFEFDAASRQIPKKNFVDYPWTCKESVKAVGAYTKDVLDCTMCGITDGQKVFMMHICPTNIENSNFYKIKNYLLKKVDILNKNLSALVLGGKQTPEDGRSIALFDNFVNFLESKGIPTTSLRGGTTYEPVNVLYTSKNDEWLISGSYLDSFINKEAPEMVLGKIFPDIKLAPDDIITK